MTLNMGSIEAQVHSHAGGVMSFGLGDSSYTVVDRHRFQTTLCPRWTAVHSSWHRPL